MARSIAERSGAPPALRALLANLIDYAGLFPPASLGLERAIANYHHYSETANAWILGRFVIPAAQLQYVPTGFEAPFAVLADADHPQAATIESKQIMRTSKPTYCEAEMAQLDAVKAAGSFAKLRTGGITPDAIPSVEDVAAYIAACGERRLPFKATAGLHHPIRSEHALTYQPGAPVGMMHGFINVFLAAAFAWHGERHITPILCETDSANFRFDNRAYWRRESLSDEEVAEARTDFAHSFGSCSFEEPMADLQELGWL